MDLILEAPFVLYQPNTLSVQYSIPSIYVASINVVSIYAVKFFVPSNFNMCLHSILIAFFWNQLRRNSRDYCKFI